MNLKYPDAAERFADEVRAFIQAELPSATRDKVIRRQKITPAEQREWQNRLCRKGWACPAWPKEYGGPGFDTLQRHIFDTVASEEGAPAAIPFGESMFAPVLFHVGTTAQKEHYLPRIRTLEYYFCQGFSEPGAGSDLASLKTRAVLDGDSWRIDGQKMWTSQAHHANMIFMLVRTSTEGKPQEGISMLAFPIDQPGITIRPIITMDGAHSTNEVFFEDVRVPADSLIGEVNKGWNYAKLLLGHERLTIARIGQSKRELSLLKRMAAEQVVDGVAIPGTGGTHYSSAFPEFQSLKTRKQFGRPIGAFQALQHRMADMVTAEHQARSMLYLAIDAVDNADAMARAQAVSAAKAQIGLAARVVGRGGIQLHGGIGMTMEYSVGHYFRRLTTLERMFGDIDYHVARFAALDRKSSLPVR